MGNTILRSILNVINNSMWYSAIADEALELATGEVKRRFDQEDLFMIREIEDLRIKSINGQKIMDISDKLQNYCTPDIDQNRLKCQLSLLSDMIKSAIQNQDQMVINVRTIVEAMNTSEIYKGMLTEVYKMLELYFTFPVTTSTAERFFSSLDRINTFLRCSMTKCRVNNLFL
uniref:HAT C-terminal dimerisation domain-containing protein n=1 Tax=Amphimedon queenslandica TaxID=400682 RepID=A0A1X7U9Z0_AMPQE